MRLFHKNKNSRSKDQNRNEFYLIFHFEFFLHIESKYNFRSHLNNLLGGDYMIPVCRDEISTRPAGAYFTLRLHVEIKFHHGKAGQFSTCYLFRFAGTFFEFFL